MQETCYCVRTVEIENREPVATEDSGRTLRCPDRGHADRLAWFPEEARRITFEIAAGHQPEAA